MRRPKYVVLIDESGNAAFDKLMSNNGYGADNHLILGAVFIETSNISKIKNLLSKIKSVLKKKSLHFTDISPHYDKLFAIKELSENTHFTAFAVISNKKTLAEKTYTPKKYSEFYHKNLCYLLERINSYMFYNGINKEDVLFVIENSSNINLNELINYIKKIRDDKNGFYLPNICLQNITIRCKKDTDLLFLADVVASSIRHLTFGQFYGERQIVEPRYLYLILPHFYRKDSSLYKGGIKFVHKLEDIELCNDAYKFFKKYE